jgi:ABC-type glycerol-3-phosphate transport system substrate-binding protein
MLRTQAVISRVPVVSTRLAPLVALALCACGDRPKPAPIRFLHTFSAAETELFNATIAERGLVVDSSIVPFARGQQVISEILRAGTSCPDLIRIDATWLVALEPQLAPVPQGLRDVDWLPDAIALVSGEGASFTAVPETVDGLFVVRDATMAAPASASVDDLVSTARAARGEHRMYPLGVRVDGYWLVPWLRANGANLGATAIDGGGAPKALADFAALFGDVAPPPPPAGSEAPDELRRWNAHEVAYWVTGPWQVGELTERTRVAVSPLAHAPRGGQLLVVPKCAKHPDEGWALATELTSVTTQTRFAELFATIPSRAGALAAAPPLVRAMHDALAQAEVLPHTAVTPLLFDDLNPALAAVVSHDATPDEAVAGVRRAWHRLAKEAPK